MSFVIKKNFVQYKSFNICEESFKKGYEEMGTINLFLAECGTIDCECLDEIKELEYSMSYFCGDKYRRKGE